MRSHKFSARVDSGGEMATWHPSMKVAGTGNQRGAFSVLNRGQ